MGLLRKVWQFGRRQVPGYCSASRPYHKGEVAPGAPMNNPSHFSLRRGRDRYKHKFGSRTTQVRSPNKHFPKFQHSWYKQVRLPGTTQV
eukprot:1104610-Rhodomonas_salina.2